MSVCTSIRGEARELRGERRGKSLVAIAGGWGLPLGTRMIYPVLLPYLRGSFGFTLTVTGLLVTIPWLGSAVGQLPGGVLADRYSERLVMTASTVVVALALVFVVTAPTPVVLFVGTGFVGLGQSLYPIARITIISEIYSDRIGSALGVTMATGDLGQTVLPPVAGLFAATIAWQARLSFVIPLVLAAGVLIRVVLPAHGSADNAVDTLSSESARYLLDECRRSNLVFVSVIRFLFFLTWQSFTGLYPTYLVEVKGLSSWEAGVSFSAFFGFGVVKPLAGAAHDRIGMRSSLVGPVAGTASLPFVEGFWALAGVTAAASTMLGPGAITQSFLSDSFADDIRGTGLGVFERLSRPSGRWGRSSSAR